MDLPTYTRTVQWSVLTSRSKAWKTRRYWPHILRQHTWEGLTYTVKPLAGRWPFSQKLIGRHTRRHTCKGVCAEEALRPAVARNWPVRKHESDLTTYSSSECKSVARPTLELSYRLCSPSVFTSRVWPLAFLVLSCTSSNLWMRRATRPCWSFRTQTSTVIVQIGWKRTHVFNKYSPQIVRSLAE